MSFEGGFDTLRDSAGIVEPPRDFPRSGTACYGCPGVLHRSCCQHDARAANHIPHGLVVSYPPVETVPAPPTPKPEPTTQKRRLFGRRTTRT